MTLITLTALENLKLMVLEQLCPFTEGTSVYQARGLLRYFDDSTYYSNPCELAAPPTPPGSGSRLANTGANANENDLAKGYNTAVFPNPASNEISITTELEGASIQLYTILGQLVLESKLSNETKISVSDLKSGTYMYNIIINDTKVKSDKLIIIH
jgi:hypothetical protein